MAAELSAELRPVGDLNDTFVVPLDVVSGPGVDDGIMICKLPFSAAAIAADTTLAGAVVVKLFAKLVRKSPGKGTLSVLAAAAAITEAGGPEETAKSEEAALSEI